MDDENRTRQTSSSQSDGKDGSSALEHEAKHVETITGSKDADHGDDEATRVTKERVLQFEQNARIEATKLEVKESGGGSNEPAKDLNRDG